MHVCIPSQDFTFPEGIGLPIGGDDKIHTHVLLEMHYDNPDEISGWCLFVSYSYTHEDATIAQVFLIHLGSECPTQNSHSKKVLEFLHSVTEFEVT